MVRTTTDKIEHMFASRRDFLRKFRASGSAGNSANVCGQGTSTADKLARTTQVTLEAISAGSTARSKTILLQDPPVDRRFRLQSLPRSAPCACVLHAHGLTRNRLT